jgi:hypothetical protein
MAVDPWESGARSGHGLFDPGSRRSTPWGSNVGRGWAIIMVVSAASTPCVGMTEAAANIGWGVWLSCIVWRGDLGLDKMGSIGETRLLHVSGKLGEAVWSVETSMCDRMGSCGGFEVSGSPSRDS